MPLQRTPVISCATVDYDAFDALLHHIFKQTQGDAWFKPSEETIQGGVCLRVDAGQYRVFPYENRHLEPFEAAVRALNPLVAVKIRSAAIHASLATVQPDADAMYIDKHTRIQVLGTMSWLPHADKEQCGAFIRDEKVLVVWAYNLDNIIPACKDFEEKMVRLAWNQRSSLVPSALPSTTNSETHLRGSEKTAESSDSGRGNTNPAVEPTDKGDSSGNKSKRRCGLDYWFLQKRGDKSLRDSPSSRPMRLFAPVYGGLAVALSIYFIGTGVNIMIQEVVLDGSYIRLALLVTAPFLFCVSIFFAAQIIGNVSMIIGPVAQYHQNSKYYSAIAPLPNKDTDSNLPHITIELPVYKESLMETIAPSVYSLKKAMQTYARQGGTSAIFVHDDGLQLISDEERKERVDFYADNNIGWVARPKHENTPDGFKRAGRFKKASNMNYGLALSLKLEKHLVALESVASERGEVPDESQECLEDKAMNLAIEEIYEDSGRRWKPWACNGKSIRLGAIILIVDADTLVPEDCFRDAARELAECPEVAIIQHESDVMQVANHYFENGIAHFTRRINKAISLGCANGEVAPFVGHNAFLRWSALQDAAFIDEADGKSKIWSESNVSEDFDMALRLQLQGYIIRWATYSNGGFREGVSLTCDDELNRWQKYAFGCNELIFNPLIHWWRLGPINKQLRTFVWSAAPVHYKISMMSYMFSYYGLAAAAVLSILNYLLLGWGFEVDGYYEKSFEIWLACTVVFPGAGNLGFTLLEYRLGHKNFLDALIENLSWVPFFFFFFGGLSIHISQALLAHIFSYNITWGATKKEVERSNFWLEVPKILKRFWLAWIICFTVCVGMVVLSTPIIPLDWRIVGSQWGVIVPIAITLGCHILYPILLNPWLMIFSY
ncbi:glycosyl transferase family group 2-domain-containing protein [Cristinia sonorae]|uniref:Glycosyl transferase family group 2-domain-containing protein n=1 Tax=Cristinia sonorae TaxID=1940300 RepID=A0A8K0UXJ5_9AGAR|nr:glycosyl transferase family group 2-domain-containing protein [Cristinia sonorae]